MTIFIRQPDRGLQTRARLTTAALALAVATVLSAAPTLAHGNVGTVNLVTRPDGATIPEYPKDGRRWVVGNPGQEYGIRVCNSTGGRLLAVMSVDGVNVISGDTASPAQSGYVLDAYQCADINGWRKSQSAIAAFYFTTLADAYATRTGRPDNLGVIGVAFFREMPRPVVWRDRPPKIAENRSDEPGARQEKAAGSVAQDSRAAEAPAPARDQLERSPAAAAPLAKMGTGWGRQESSYVQTTRFERESASPNETLAINYDRRENLVAMGILPPQAIARSADPFPAWTPRFAPEPPR